MCVKDIKGNLHNIRDMQNSTEILLSWKWANLLAEGQGQLLSERFTIILRYHSIRNIMLCVVSIYKNIAYFSCLEFPVGACRFQRFLDKLPDRSRQMRKVSVFYSLLALFRALLWTWDLCFTIDIILPIIFKVQ